MPDYVTVLLSVGLSLVSMLAATMYQPIAGRLRLLSAFLTWPLRIPRGYRSESLLRTLKRGRALSVLGQTWLVSGMTEYDSEGERFFEFTLTSDHADDDAPSRSLLFSGEETELWAEWRDVGFWRLLGLKPLPALRPLSMPFLEERLKTEPHPVVAVQVQTDRPEPLRLRLTDLRRGSVTTNLFGGTRDTPAPYARRSKGAVGVIERPPVDVYGLKREIEIALYEYGESELLDNFFIGIQLDDAHDLRVLA